MLSHVTIFACSPPDDIAIELAKKYIKDRGLTHEDVVLGKKDGCIVAKTKREVSLGKS